LFGSSNQALTISERIDLARTRLIALGGLFVALGYFTTAVIELSSAEQADPAHVQVLFSGGMLGVAAVVISALKRRRTSALLLAAGLAGITTWQLLGFGLSFEIALASYVGVLLITIVGSSQSEALIATLVTVAIGLYAYWNVLDSAPSLPGTLAVFGLLAATGLTLSWLQDNLLMAIGQLEVSRARLRRLSHQDPLTGLGNRRLFDESVKDQLAFINPDRPLALVIIDVDKLKSVNDQHGHPTGDLALQAVADAIRASTRESDRAARIGGDEFGIVLPTGGIVGARRVADRIHEHLDHWSANGASLTVSIGVAEATDPNDEVAALLTSADTDMYAVRKGVLAGASPKS
jgi:diguanylate cyclase (GGDEF)-like protein